MLTQFRSLTNTCCLLALFMLAHTAAADDEHKSADKQEAKAEVKPGTVIDCYFLADEEYPIAFHPVELGWAVLRVEDAVPHGTSVNKADTLINFQRRKLDEEIADQRHAVADADRALAKGKRDLELSVKSLDLSIEVAKRAEEDATENLKRFLTKELEQRKQSLDFSLRSAENFLAYEEEELKQLTRMYEADDLTEETEEIILRRTKDDVDRSRHYMKVAENSHEKSINVDLPRQEVQLKEALRSSTLAVEKAVAQAEMDIARKEADVERLRVKLDRATERLERLRQDAERFTITSPAKGLVYYGRQTLGKWSDATPLLTSLRTDGAVKPYEVFMTIVGRKISQVTGTLPESALAKIAEGDMGKLTVPAAPDWKLDAEVINITEVPVSNGKHGITLKVRLPEGQRQVVPGMTCKVTFAEAGDENAAGDDGAEEDSEAEDKNKDAAS